MKSHNGKSHGCEPAMNSNACGEKPLIRNQLLSKGTGHFGVIALASSIGREVMRRAHEPAPPAAARGLPRSRPLPPIQGYARAHRSAFEQIARPQPQGVLLGLMRRAYLDRHGVGVWAIQPTAVILAVLGVGV